jgi:hypothetical protein
MKHLEEGQLRAYCDDALSEEERERVLRHLGTCARCAREAATIQARGARVGTWLASIDPQPVDEPVSPQVARHRFRKTVGRLRADREKEHAMRRNVFARRYRPAWAIVGVVLALVIALSFAPVRTLAGNLLSLFRVHKIEFVEVDPTQMPDEDTLEAAARRFESMMEDQITIERDGEPQEIDEATARSLSAFRVRLPAALDDEPRITLQPGVHAEMEVDLPRIRALLAELGYDDVQLPDSLDGAQVSIDLYPSVAAAYGACESESVEREEEGGAADFNEECTILMQVLAPVVSAPPELDLDQLGQAYLQLLGMSAEEAARFSQRVDWATTLVVPIPSSTNLSYQDVNVDGVTGALLRPPRHSRNWQEYMLTWVKNDVVYALHGSGTVEDALDIAASLQ